MHVVFSEFYWLLKPVLILLLKLIPALILIDFFSLNRLHLLGQ